MTFTIQDQFCINFFSRLAFQNIFKCLFLLHCMYSLFIHKGLRYTVECFKQKIHALYLYKGNAEHCLILIIGWYLSQGNGSAGSSSTRKIFIYSWEWNASHHLCLLGLGGGGVFLLPVKFSLSSHKKLKWTKNIYFSYILFVQTQKNSLIYSK